MEPSYISTRFLILSDTHGKLPPLPADRIDVAIHCGDLTDGSKLSEFETSFRLMESLNAPLKLVVAGNHDFTLDIPSFAKKIDDIPPPVDDELVRREYGSFGEIRELFNSKRAKEAGIVLLEEGIHHFQLANGAKLTPVYSLSLSDWGFTYNPEQDHVWNIDKSVDVAISHGPPQGIFDRTHDGERAGSPSLFAAIARSRPLLHCFGHIHEGWGARKVMWFPETNDTPSHFTDINNDESALLANLSSITIKTFDDPETVARKTRLRSEYEKLKYCSANVSLERGMQTLFVNAAIEDLDEDLPHFPWLVNINLSAKSPQP